MQAWDGIAIEASKKHFSRLKKNRKCRVLNFAVSSSEEEVEFYDVEGELAQMSGINNSDYTTKEFVEKDTKSKVNKYKIKTTTFEKIIPSEKIIDYLSIDTEGNEAFNDDCCGYYGPSTVSVYAYAGTVVTILWTNSWNPGPFTFTVEESDPPTAPQNLMAMGGVEEAYLEWDAMIDPFVGMRNGGENPVYPNVQSYQVDELCKIFLTNPKVRLWKVILC